MTLRQALETGRPILTEGSVIERIRRSPGVALDPHVDNARLVLDEAGRAALEAIYRGYLEIGRDHGLPMVALTPTWKASPDNLAAAGLADADINGRCVRLLAEIRGSFGDYACRVHLGGLMGCRGDAYRPEQALATAAAADYHRPQAAELAAAGAEFLLASTLPARSEALGLALALADSGLDYLLSFVVRPDGTLLDGTLLGDVVREIDDQAPAPPLGYLLGCVHPTVFEGAVSREMERVPELAGRLLGLQANTSAHSPEELEGRQELDEEDPHRFAGSMAWLRRWYGVRVLGGCCGTDERHIRALAERLA